VPLLGSMCSPPRRRRKTMPSSRIPSPKGIGLAGRNLKLKRGRVLLLKFTSSKNLAKAAMGKKGKGRKTTPKPMMAASNANNYNVDDRQGRVAEEILLSAKLETQLLGDCNILNTDSAPHRRRSGDLGCHHSARAGEKFVHTSTTVTNFIMSRAKYRRRLAVDFHCRLFGMKCWILSPEASFLEIRSQRTIWYLISFLMEQN